MAPPLLALQNIGLTLGGVPLLQDAELSLAPRERICLVGRNGSGKSTLLRIAAGEIEPDRGRRFVQPQTSLRYLPQEPSLAGFSTTVDYVAAGLGPADDPHRARYLLERLGLVGEAEPQRLSGGEARRAALARVLAADPDILLLDEPTNHLDIVAIEWLEAELASLRCAMVIVSHDRRFLQNLSSAVIWLDRGRTRRLDRPFGEFEAWRDQVLDEEERDRHKLDRRIAAEEDWVRYGVTARRKRNVRRMGELETLRNERRTARRLEGEVRLEQAKARESGSLVIEADHVSKAFDGRPIVEDFSTRILRKDRVGVLGANGAGKTTLLNLLIGALAPDRGHARLGENVMPAVLDQTRATLRGDATLADALTGGGGDWVEIAGKRKHVAGYMKDFLFTPDQARTPVSRLSGGERARVTLARALSLPSNLLVLDEPTNDLDVETLDLLQELLSDYSGAVIVVSHDRDFIDRVASSVLVAEGGGRWREYAGGYSDMVAQRGFGLSGAPPVPPPAPKESLRAKSAPDAAPQATRRRLSFKDKHALETLPTRMGELQTQMADLQRALNDPNLFGRDPKGFESISLAYARAQTELSAAEEQWLELEILREELGG